MKDLDTAAAPMISVPAGVLKEFMSPSNSRTPTPPLTTASSTTLSSSTTTVTEASAASPFPSPSSSPLPALDGSITTALQTATDNIATITSANSNGSTEVDTKSRTSTPNSISRTSSPALPVPKDKTSVTITSASTPVQVNGKDDDDDKENLLEEMKQNDESNSLVNGLSSAVGSQKLVSITSDSASSAPSSPAVFPTGVKRSISDEESAKPDLKKIRVFPSVSKDGGKRELKITYKEEYEQLDLKLQTIKNATRQDLVTLSRVKNGIAVLSGERVPNTDSPTNSPSATPSPAPPTNADVEDATTPGLPEQTTAPAKDQSLFNKENIRASRDRERKLSKNGLKDAILRVFSENALYGPELGHLKQMCEKLTSTVEVNMRKVAQFHKEIEDLRKVTTRLAAEHQARKGQYVAPIRIKRSVGIQAAPHIINKGIMHANVGGGNIKTISPRTSSVVGVLPSSMSQNLIQGSTVGIITSSSGMRPATLTGIPTPASGITGTTATSIGTAVRAPNGQIMMMAPAGTMQPLTRPAAGMNTTTTVLPVAQGRVVRAPIGNISSVGPHTGTLIGTQRPILIQNDKSASPAPTIQTPLAGGRGGGVIDLTDEDEGAKGVVNRGNVAPKPGTLMKVPSTGTAQLVPLQGGGVGQVVLLPNTSGGQPTTALIVSQVSTGQTQENITNPVVAQARITTYANHTSSSNRVQGSTPPAPARTTVTTPSPTTTLQQSNNLMRHPAPLPKTPVQQVGGISKKLPPQPTLKLSHKDSSIVLSWTMAKTEDHETIASYQLYAYQEGAAPPSANLWKKVGSVKALELPMACTLTQFMPGHVYHFAVRAVDIKSRLGPFSEPRSIRLDKK